MTRLNSGGLSKPRRWNDKTIISQLTFLTSKRIAFDGSTPLDRCVKATSHLVSLAHCTAIVRHCAAPKSIEPEK
jgi:hypothetical protein